MSRVHQPPRHAREAGAAAFCEFLQNPRPLWLKDGTLEDNAWLVELDNPTIRRHASTTIRFDILIAPDRRLTDYAEWRDLLTAKKYVYYALTGPNAWVRSASTIREEYAGFVAFLRWRTACGLPGMSDLTQAWFEEFCDSMKHAGMEGLIRSEAAAREAVKRCRHAGRAPPVQQSDPNTFSVEAASRLAGFEYSKQLSDNAAKIFADWAVENGLKITPCLHNRVNNRKRDQTFCGQSLDRYMRVWERLGRLQEELTHDPIGYRPFNRRIDSARLARKLGAPLSKTPTAPATQTCFLIDRALRWVLFYADDLKTLVDDVRHAERGFRNEPGKWRRAKLVHDIWNSPALKHVREDGALGIPSIGHFDGAAINNVTTSLHHIFLRLLPTACVIVIAAFSARRIEEILSLRDDCLEDDGGELWLKTFIAKSVRGRERIPAPAAVAKAVEILMWLSATARKESGSRWLLQLHNPFARAPSVQTPNISRGLLAFAEEMKVPALPDGTYWSFAPHQFRRFFAVVYYYRYRDRSLTALSQYLCHYDPDSTRSYITEARFGGFFKLVDHARADLEQARRALAREDLRLRTFEEVGLDFRLEIYRRALDGHEQLSGRAGTRILNDLQRLKADWQARAEVGDYGADGPTFDRLLIEFAGAQSLEPNGQGHSYCACGNSEKDLSVAGCVIAARRKNPEAQRRQGPDLRYAEDLICAGCPHNVQLAENRRYWEKVIESANSACLMCPGTVLAARMAERRQAAEDHLARFHGVDQK